MYRRGDQGQVARALRILNALRGYPEGRTIADLARDAKCSEKTVKRDLAELVEAEIQIARTLIDGRAAARLEEESHRSVALTQRERYTLLAIRRMFDVLEGTPFAEDVESVFAKLHQRVSPVERAQVVRDRDRFAYVPDGGIKLYRGKEDVLDALQSGVMRRNVVKFAYRAGRGRSQRGYLAPFSMLLFKHGLYVIGRRLDDPGAGHAIPAGQPDIFAAERFVSAQWMRGHTFNVPPDFDLDDVLTSAFELHVRSDKAPTRVTIEFSKERAGYARARRWHKSQTVEEQADGSVLISFKCVNFAPVVSWVLEWGPHARVLAPDELVELVIAELDAARASYNRRGTYKRPMGKPS